MSASTGKPTGSGPGGSITPEDIKARVEGLAAGVEGQVQAKVPLLRYAAIGGAVVVVLAAFMLGRRSGRRRSTVVESGVAERGQPASTPTWAA